MGMGSIDRGGSPQRPGMSQADIRRMQLLVVADRKSVV